MDECSICRVNAGRRVGTDCFQPADKAWGSRECSQCGFVVDDGGEDQDVSAADQCIACAAAPEVDIVPVYPTAACSAYPFIYLFIYVVLPSLPAGFPFLLSHASHQPLP